MLEDFSSNEECKIPNNYIKFLDTPEMEDLVIGATNKFAFRLGFILKNYYKKITVYFSQGDSVVQTYTSELSTPARNATDLAKGTNLEVLYFEHNTYILVTVSPEDSKAFEWQRLCSAQAKIELTDDSIIYTEIKNIQVKEPLEFDRFKENESWEE